MKFKKGDRVIGYWKLRTKECEKLFEGILIEDPFKIDATDFTNELMVRDGFKDITDGLNSWFKPRYGPDFVIMDFVVLRWKVTQISQQLRNSDPSVSAEAERAGNSEIREPIPASSGREKEKKEK